MKLIDKSAVIAEINRVLNSYDQNEITSGRYTLVDLRNFLDTPKVKEVDLQKENKELINKIVDRFEFENFTFVDIDGSLNFDYAKFSEFLEEMM